MAPGSGGRTIIYCEQEIVRIKSQYIQAACPYTWTISSYLDIFTLHYQKYAKDTRKLI